MSKIRISAEAFHKKIMTSAMRYAWAFGDGDKETAALIEPLDMDDPIELGPSPEETLLGAIFDEKAPEYGSMGTFELPGGSTNLIYYMAKATLANPLSTAKLVGLDISGFPYETFCLGELLHAAYPRDPRSGIMRATVGATFLTGDWDTGENDPRDRELFLEYAMHRMFAGVGVIMMEQSRKILDSSLSDDDVIREASRRELYLVMLPQQES